MALKPNPKLDIRPRPAGDPPRDGDVIYDPKRGGWYPAPRRA
ncbi:hypothetical protein [Streptomyces bohaiensis]|nr:hypothetical protein [Streptomyces bohaiensis]